MVQLKNILIGRILSLRRSQLFTRPSKWGQMQKMDDNIEDEFIQPAPHMRTYKYFKNNEEGDCCKKREVLEANELAFGPDDGRVIVCNEFNGSYMVFDSKDDLLKYLEEIVGPKSFHEVIGGSH